MSPNRLSSLLSYFSFPFLREKRTKAPLPLGGEFAGDKPFCDLVMKGGGASDVVYPLAIVELAKKYRFRSIGGTSSGALAASIAAAAEYARERDGFQRLAAIPDETAEISPFNQFQPNPAIKPLFNMLVAAGAKNGLAKAAGLIAAALFGYPLAVFAGALPGLLVSMFVAKASDNGWLAFGILLGLLGVALALSGRILFALVKEFPRANFGLCSGQTVDDRRGPAVTDWLADNIDQVAGNVGRHPLTFGDLKAHNPPIELKMMTTDLAMKRPYRLPFDDGAQAAHFFSKAEFERLFPPRVIHHMCNGRNPLRREPCWDGCPDDLYSFPDEADLPVVVAARMSLCLPFIIETVPIYKRDLTLNHDANRPRKCLFSDGGITSNFPIHFFDRLWPNRPTFGISFDTFSKKRHMSGTKEVRLEMNHGPADGEVLGIEPVTGLGEFLAGLIGSATDWQDTLLGLLPGYRERIVHVHLKADEGGINLKMSRETIERLTEIGKEAGALAAGPAFDMDEHRWRRFLVAMAEMEQTLDELAQAYEDESVPGGSFREFLERYGFNKSYPPINEAWKAETLRRAGELVHLGILWREEPRVRSGRIPRPDCDLRIAPRQ